MRSRICKNVVGTWSRYLFHLTRQSQSVSRLMKAGGISRDPCHTPITVETRGLAGYSKDNYLQRTESDELKRFADQMDSEDAVFVDADDNQDFNTDRAYQPHIERFESDTKTVAQLAMDYEHHMSREPNTPENSKIIRVAIIGTANSGKSTLINSLIGWKINGVSVKVNTTGENTSSVLTKDDTQIVIIDTPGVMNSEARIRHGVPIQIEREIEESVIDADIIGIIFDCAGRTRFHEKVLKILHENSDKPSFLIMNKIDLLKDPTDTLPLCGKLTNRILGGQKFGQSDLERSREKLQRGQFRDEEEFEKKLKELEKKYGKLDCLIAKEGGSEAVGFDQVQVNITEQEMDLEKTKETVPMTQLEEDSYQKQFLEEILQSNVGENNSDCDISKTEENMSLGPIGKSWVEKLEKAEKQSFEYRKYPYWSNFDAVFPVSALKGDGIGYILEFLFKNAKPGPWLYHSSLVTCQNPMQIAKMCVRQSLLDHVEQYLPYVVDINVLYWNVTNYNRLEIVMELLVKNRYEMGLILKNQPKQQAAPSKRMHEHVRFKQPYLNDTRDFQGQSWRITQIACDAKQALLDAFRCEIKFKLGVRLDKSVKRKNDTGMTRKLLRRPHGVQKHGAVV